MSRLKQLVTRLRRPDMREVAVAQVSDKYSEYPSNGLTPVKLAEILREADAGDVLRQMELFEEMEEKDPHLFSQLQTRKNAVTGLDFEVIPFGDEPLDKEIADFKERSHGPRLRGHPVRLGRPERQGDRRVRRSADRRDRGV